ncbi:MAG: hypothetical protein II877_04000 [Synergistaceae bacterium]|nr:hypothetical protein [Synergistaceae bacterium]
MPKGKSGIKHKRSKTFAWSGSGKISPEAVKAVFEAPIGTVIHAKFAGFGSYGASDYEITLHGMSKKMLSYKHKPEDGYHQPVVLSKVNIKKKLSGAELTLEYPR